MSGIKRFSGASRKVQRQATRTSRQLAAKRLAACITGDRRETATERRAAEKRELDNTYARLVCAEVRDAYNRAADTVGLYSADTQARELAPDMAAAGDQHHAAVEKARQAAYARLDH